MESTIIYNYQFINQMQYFLMFLYDSTYRSEASHTNVFFLFHTIERFTKIFL